MAARRSALAALGTCLLLAACTPAGPAASGPNRPVSPTPTGALSNEPAAASSSSWAPGSQGAGQGPPTGPPATSGAVPIDPALLAHLPSAVDGLAVVAAPESDAVAATDPVVVANAEAVATALAIDPASGDFAHATVVALRSGVMTAAFYRSWRDSFDEGACSQAGGVVGHAEAQLGGRDAYIGTCAGGVRTYHVWLNSAGVLVSVTSAGERRIGEQLAGGLLD